MPPPLHPAPPVWEEPIQPASRPSGLTVLAVLNFVFGGMALLNAPMALLMSASFPWFEKQLSTANNTPGMPEWVVKMNEFSLDMLNPTVLYTTAFFAFVTGVLMLISGFGYLKQQRGRGRMVGNMYVLVGIISMIALTYLARMNLLLHSIDLIYPLITVYLINVTFKDDFVR